MFDCFVQFVSQAGPPSVRFCVTKLITLGCLFLMKFSDELSFSVLNRSTQTAGATGVPIPLSELHRLLLALPSARHTVTCARGSMPGCATRITLGIVRDTKALCTRSEAGQRVQTTLQAHVALLPPYIKGGRAASCAYKVV